MKNIKNKILVILIGLTIGLYACESFLTVDIPDTLIKEDYWETKEHLDAALNGVYTYLGTNIQRFIQWGDLRSDLYYWGAKATTYYQQMVNQMVTVNNSLCNWATVYTGINNANSFIKNAHLVLAKDPSLTQEELRSMEAEAYALRALYYFYLVRAFGDVPMPLEPYESDTQNAYLPPSSDTTVLDTIEADLQRALRYAPESFNSIENHYGRITKNAVRAIWADVKLWRGGEQNYLDCIALCEELERVYDSKMIPASIWFNTFSEGNVSESIFEYQFVDEGPNSLLSSLYSIDVTTDNSVFRGNMAAFLRNVLKVYPRTFASYATSDTVRFHRTYRITDGYMEVFKYTGISYENGRYIARSGLTTTLCNFIFYRFREVLLIKAEALAMLGRYSEAIKPINKIRAATGLQQLTASEYGTGELFFDKLLAERTAELAYEGKQWFSMVRVALHTGFDNLLINRITETSMTSIRPQTMRARLLEKEGWFLPYFDTEVQKNPWLDQKKYYEGKN